MSASLVGSEMCIRDRSLSADSPDDVDNDPSTVVRLQRRIKSSSVRASKCAISGQRKPQKPPAR
eukprot:12034448-Alexandrium_andersonii.AAC.1